MSLLELTAVRLAAAWVAITEGPFSYPCGAYRAYMSWMVEPRRLATVIAAVVAVVFGLGAYTASVAQAHSLEPSTLTRPADPDCMDTTSSVPCAQPCAALCHILAPAEPGLTRPLAVVSLAYRMSPEAQAGRPAPPDPPPPR